MIENDLPRRKQRHLDLCLDPLAPVESGSTRLKEIRLPHRSLPELNIRDVDISSSFLGCSLAAPLLISSMTGGSPQGRQLSSLLAQAAEKTGIAMGMGSLRVMLEHPHTRDHFTLKKKAPHVPILANLGAVQVREYPREKIIEAVKSLEADGLYIHLNPGQEIFQEEGERDFSGLKKAIFRLKEAAPFPLLVKETGAGIPPREGLELLRGGVDYVDAAGSGGTDWIAVEILRHKKQGWSEEFRNWGYPTAELLLAYQTAARRGGPDGDLIKDRIIASGGLRGPLDAAVSLAAGAVLAGMALPFLRAAAEEGLEGVVAAIQGLIQGLKTALALTGCSRLEAFRRLPLRVSSSLRADALELYKEIDFAPLPEPGDSSPSSRASS